MVSVAKQDDLVYGYIEWNVLNKGGQFEEGGNYVWINDLWISPKRRRKEVLRELIRLVDQDPLTKNCEYVYWCRGKYNNRQSVYWRDRFKRG